MSEQKEILKGLVNSIYVQETDINLSGPYDISVMLESVLVPNSESQEGENVIDYSRLSDVIFGKYVEDNLVPFGYDFKIGKQSLLGYLDDTKINWIKQFYGIFALQDKGAEIWDPIRERAVEYLGNVDNDIKAGEYLGSFFSEEDVRAYVLIKNEYYNPNAVSGKEMYKYRLLDEDEIACYSLDNLGSEISMLQQQALANNFWNMFATEQFNTDNTVAIANAQDIASIFKVTTPDA